MNTEVLENPNNEVCEEIKSYVDKIGDAIRALEDMGYDTKEIYKLHGMLKYEILNQETIEQIANSEFKDKLQRDLKIFSETIGEQLKLLDKNKEEIKKLNESHEKLKNSHNEIKKPSLDLKNDFRNTSAKIKSAILVFISAISIYGGVKLGKKTIQDFHTGYKTTEYTFVSTGLESEKVSYKAKENFSRGVVIIDYSKADSKGNRIKKTYVLRNMASTDYDYLMSLDFGDATPTRTEIVNDPEANEISKDAFRSYSFEVNDYTQTGRAKRGLGPNIMTIVLLAVEATSLITLLYTLNEFHYSETLLYFSDIVIDIANDTRSLIKYKIALKSSLKELKLNKK